MRDETVTHACDDLDAVLALGLPLSAEPLPDSLALHVEACPRCAAAFNAHFPPVAFGPAPAPASLRRPWPSVPSALAPLALAAAALLIGLQVPDPPGRAPVMAAEHPVSLLSVEDTPRLAWCEDDPAPELECLLEQGV